MSSIIISQNQQHSQRIDESSFDKEDSLQSYLYDNPDIIPIYDIDEDARLYIAAREFSTEHGPIDALGFDHVGNVYIIETKLFRNADKRRVVAQMLDYGAALWRHATSFDAFLQQVDTYTKDHFGHPFREHYEQFFGFDDASEQMLAMRDNLAEGNLKFVVLIDQIDERLRDVIMYVNQNSKFDIYAVDFKYYTHDQLEIVIPRLYGAEVKKTVAASGSSGRRQWNEADFFAAVNGNRELVSPEQRSVVYALWKWAKRHDAQINWGTGAIWGKFSPVFKKIGHTRSFCSISIDGATDINYCYLDEQADRVLLRDILKQHIGGVCSNVTDIDASELSRKGPVLPAKIMVQIVDKVIAALDEFIKRKEKDGNQ